MCAQCAWYWQRPAPTYQHPLEKSCICRIHVFFLFLLLGCFYMYTMANTCLLSVYGHLLACQVAGTYNMEQRQYRTTFKHVVHVVSTHERAIFGLPPCSSMLPGHAYIVYTIHHFKAGEFRRWAWIFKNMLVLPQPYRLRVGERPGRGPTPLRSITGHISLLRLLNSLAR